MKFTITVSDVAGGVEANVDFEGGYSTHSNSHQIGRIILKYLDSVLEKGPVTVDAGPDVEGVPV